MALPRLLKLMNVFNNGHSYQGIAEEVEQPKLAMKIEDFRTASMLGEVSAVEITMRGRHAEVDPGNAKSGDKTETTIKTALTYYKLTVDDKDLMEIDMINSVFKVDGVDRYAELRAAIGL